MKFLIKNFVIFLTITSCSFYNSVYTATYDALSIVTPNQYAVKKSTMYDQTLFPQNGMGIVSLRFKIVGSERGVDSLWRRIEYGYFSGKKYFTHNFSNDRVELMIEPGTYFLDGIKFFAGDMKAKKGAFVELFSDEPRGWNVEEKKALWFSFAVKPAQTLLIPDITLFAYCKNEAKSCDESELILMMKLDDDLDQWAKKYWIGYDIVEK